MTEDLGVGVVLLQGTEQVPEGCLLGWSTGIFGYTLGIETAFVTDADGVGVIMTGVDSRQFLGTCDVELAISGDVVVIADRAETGFVAGFQLFQREIAVAFRCTAMNDNHIYSAHVDFIEH